MIESYSKKNDQTKAYTHRKQQFAVIGDTYT